LANERVLQNKKNKKRGNNMATRVISSVHEDYAGDDIAIYINSLTGASYDDLQAALTGMGVTAAGTYVQKYVVPKIAAKLLSALTLVGYGIGLATLVGLIEAEQLEQQRNEVLNDIKARGGRLRVYTEYVEWSSGSGNHYTEYTRTRYARVA